MSNRTIRRAMERKALKLQRKQLQTAAAAVATTETVAETAELEPNGTGRRQTTQAQITANQSNAQKSTGPLTSQGKAASSRNAVKHGLTGNTVLLDSDDADEYQTRLDYYTALYQPATFEERRLVQAIHDANWRLDRIANLESTVYAKGRIELEGSFEEMPQPQRKNFIQFEITQRYAKELRNLNLQESRIQRQRAKDLAALKELQAERRQAEADKAAEEAAAAAAVKPPPQPNGFVFSTPEFDPKPPVSPEETTSKSHQEAA